jgi:hypothetical protein
MTDQYVTGLADEIADKVAARLGAADPPMWTVKQLAEHLSIKERSARTLIEGDPQRGIEPAIPSVMVGGGNGSRRIDPRDVARYVRSRQDCD